MKLLYRYIFQILFWFVIWTLLLISGGASVGFIEANGFAFILQILMIAGIIYYAVPKLLFKKKYIYFFIALISTILLSATLAMVLSPLPPLDRPPLTDVLRGPGRGPSRFLIHLLMMTISSVTAVLLETLIFARENEKSVAIAKAELIESELKFLKMQINPHFLFNALNNIYALSITNSDKTQESISTLSEMLRYVIYDCEQPKVTLNKELDYLENYIQLFQLKSSKSFDISYEKKVSDSSVLVAPMLFVPFIENAFKHSGVEKGGDHFVHISISETESEIKFTVVNSIPSESATVDSHGGIGLPNVQKRLAILYPDKHELKISKSEVFQVNLKLELQ